MRLLVDTCTFLWIALDDPKLSETARREFRNPDNEVYLSAASAWEIAVKSELGRIPLPVAAARFVPDRRARLGIASLPIDEESSLQAGRLPGPHRDPFDRMLVAQAIVHGLVILGPDEAIARYPVRTLW